MNLSTFINSYQQFIISKGSTKLEKAEILQLTVEHLRGLKYGAEYGKGEGSLNDIGNFCHPFTSDSDQDRYIRKTNKIEERKRQHQMKVLLSSFHFVTYSDFIHGLKSETCSE